MTLVLSDSSLNKDSFLSNFQELGYYFFKDWIKDGQSKIIRATTIFNIYNC